jgi:hypothetical protein
VTKCYNNISKIVFFNFHAKIVLGLLYDIFLDYDSLQCKIMEPRGCLIDKRDILISDDIDQNIGWNRFHQSSGMYIF